MKPKVGFTGLGIMGTAMAANVHKAGFPLQVYNRTAAKTETFVKQGVGVAATPASLAQDSDIIIIMVTGPEAIDHLLWGEGGAAQALNDNKTLINMSSVSPGYTRELHQRLVPTGVTFIDAPVSGTKQPAEQGTLVILPGGPKNRIAYLEPLFLAMGKKVVYCGDVGQGSMMKMFINLLVGVMMEGLAEVLNFGSQGGLSMEAMLDTLFAGAMNSPMFQVKAPHLQKREYPVAFPLKHLAKDLKFVVDTAYDLKAPVPVAQTLLHLFDVGVAKGWGDEDISAIARVLEHLNPKS